MRVVDAMAGHHFQGRGHSHGHHHFHSRALHVELDQPDQLEATGATGNSATDGINAIPHIVARENNLNEKPVGSSTKLPIILGVW